MAIRQVLGGADDLLIAAPTAGGKTEAAFLPIATRLAAAPPSGLGCLCISPLKALINDQFERLELLFGSAGLGVHRWHGDVPGSRKQRVLRGEGHLLLITPESLEACFVLRGSSIRRLFGELEYVVVDELHAFLGSVRGRQLQSLLRRLEVALERRIPRLGLSATLGDLGVAARLLRPEDAGGVRVVSGDSGEGELRLQLRGYTAVAPRLSEDGSEVADEASSREAIADHLFGVLRGGNHLVFANSRQRVELLADDLRSRSEAARLPNEFLPHHGSLSREIREQTEERLKDPNRPATVVCTSTLELGIDVGHVDSVVQVGRPQSVTSLRQRLGRSGRRAGEPATLRLYVEEPFLDGRSAAQDTLRPALVESVAVVELLLENQLEGPAPDQLHLSTLVQQVLSMIAERGGITAQELWQVLGEGGPFAIVGAGGFTRLLRELGRRDLIAQAGDGDLVLGLAGERLTGHYSFFTAFASPEEYVLQHSGKTLGTLPTSRPLAVGLYLIFAGRRWKVKEVDEERRIVQLEPARGALPPVFGGGGLWVGDEVRRRMRRLYAETCVPAYLDAEARRLLAEGRGSFERLELAERAILAHGLGSLFFPWIGDRGLHALELILVAAGLEVVNHGIALEASRIKPPDLVAAFRKIRKGPPPDPVALASRVRNLRSEKYDGFLPADLLAADYASRALDVPTAWSALAELESS